MCRVYQMPTFYLYRQHISPDEEGGCALKLRISYALLLCAIKIYWTHLLSLLLLSGSPSSSKAIYLSGGKSSPTLNAAVSKFAYKSDLELLASWRKQLTKCVGSMRCLHFTNTGSI